MTPTHPPAMQDREAAADARKAMDALLVFTGMQDHARITEQAVEVYSAIARMEAALLRRDAPREGASVGEAAARLLAKLDVVHNDYRYQGVWAVAHAHGSQYDGPTYTAELAALTAALSPMEAKKGVG